MLRNHRKSPEITPEIVFPRYNVNVEFCGENRGKSRKNLRKSQKSPKMGLKSPTGPMMLVWRHTLLRRVFGALLTFSDVFFDLPRWATKRQVYISFYVSYEVYLKFCTPRGRKRRPKRSKGPQNPSQKCMAPYKHHRNVWSSHKTHDIFYMRAWLLGWVYCATGRRPFSCPVSYSRRFLWLRWPDLNIFI